MGRRTRMQRARIRRQVASYRQCDPCGGKRVYPDSIGAKVDGAYWSQRVYACPSGQGFHLTSQEVQRAG